MSDTTELLSDASGTSAASGDTPTRAAAKPRARRSGTGLSAKVLPELQKIAAELGISGTGRMRKSQLIAAIQEKQGGGSGEGAAAPAAEAPAAAEAAPATERPTRTRRERSRTQAAEEPAAQTTAKAAEKAAEPVAAAATATAPAAAPAQPEPVAAPAEPVAEQQEQPAQPAQPASDAHQGESRSERGESRRERRSRGERRDRNGNDRNGNGNGNGGNGNDRGDHRGDHRSADSGSRGDQRGGDQRGDGDDDRGGRGRRGRFRERSRGRGRDRFDSAEPVIGEDDVLIPIAGILDILDNYAFVRTSGYLPGSNDVYVSLAQIRRNGLRKGDVITGAVRQPREGERREKFNALVRLDTVNGMDPEQARNRPDFNKLTPLYPQERLRLETEPNILTTRIIDLVSPIGKGQRGLIVSPPKAGKTMVLQAIA
ncbi:MAG TPA: Rho termination factor N-terminal domain-containing protein, partial [Nonomuraea sp.]|nr:Rho termination factor N-terminal domain-containing protein [Nonomuraea sp.]